MAMMKAKKKLTERKKKICSSDFFLLKKMKPESLLIFQQPFGYFIQQLLSTYPKSSFTFLNL